MTSINSENLERTSPLAPATPLLCRQVSKRFGDKLALDGLSLSIPGFGVTAILGANGAGKTTLISCALGLVKPSSGDISLFGKAPGLAETKRLIGVMLQDSNLPDLLSAREHIELFQSYYHDPLALSQLSELCDLDSFVDQRYKKLSGGQKRCVQFALSILGQPKIVFLDEPTTGLDISARKTLWKTISQLSQNGTAVVLTTHYLEEADALADHTIVMSKGRVIADAPTEQIRASASGAMIRCSTTLEPQTIAKVAHVTSVDHHGKQLEIRSSDASKSLKKLFELDPSLSNLTISKSSLEDAFLELNRKS